jgi:hypothetical protein
MRNALGWLGALATVAITAGCDPKSTSTAAPVPSTSVAPVATCADGVKNGAESDIDCGGTCGACVVDKVCRVGADCADQLCEGNRCTAASTKDGLKNGTETDVDCGGGSGRKCAAPKGCAVDDDCVSSQCVQRFCQVSPGDGLKNGDESDIDCGGLKAAKCKAGKKCGQAADCDSAVCIGKLCQAATNNDGVKNLEESGVDCGGNDLAVVRCAAGQACADRKDCAQNSCNAQTKLCEEPSINGKKDGNETDVDCGGVGAPACVAGKECQLGADCESVRCEGVGVKTCAVATATDAVKNGDESDVDCGGVETNAPKCAIAKSCIKDGDCVSDGCGYNKKCVVARSCSVRFGGDTCGAGEVGNANATHESCCKSLPLNATTRIDKYSITAGRIREFVRRTGGNVRAYIEANPNPTIPVSQYAVLPTGLGGQYGIREHLGQTTFYSDRPCPGCGQGCWLGSIAQGGYGHNSYYWDDATQASYGAIPRSFSQEQLDVKTMNCITEPMLAAFCVWDGGRLASAEELREAWGNADHPWGATPSYNDTAARMTNWNPWGTTLFSNPSFRYHFPEPGNAAQTDQSFAIAAPGRMTLDKRVMNDDNGQPNGVMDLAANIIQVTSSLGNPDDAAHGSFPRATWVGGSWEGHWGGKAGWGNFSYNTMTKYGKAGGRCVRPR